MLGFPLIGCQTNKRVFERVLLIVVFILAAKVLLLRRDFLQSIQACHFSCHFS